MFSSFEVSQTQSVTCVKTSTEKYYLFILNKLMDPPTSPKYQLFKQTGKLQILDKKPNWSKLFLLKLCSPANSTS